MTDVLRPVTAPDRHGGSPRAVCGSQPAVALGYVGVIVAANLAATSGATLNLELLVVPVGALCAGATLEVRDHVHEAFGPCGVALAIACGTGLSWLLASPAVAAASALAFLVSETIDALFYAGLMRWRSRELAMVGSNVAGLAVDSVVFVPLAFGTWAALPGQVVGKLLATALAAGLHAATRAARSRLVTR
jgi:uncharacterized PurR-regulated membrane protein YhhQ (DUF165 family)